MKNLKINNIIILLFIITLIVIFIKCAGGTTNEDNNSEMLIPAEVVEFNYSIPDGMIEDTEEKEKMIKAKIEHLRKINALYWGELPGTEDELLIAYSDIGSFINSNFTGFKGLDVEWDEFTDEYYRKMEQASHYGDFAYVMSKMGYALKEGHTHIVPSRLLGEGRNFLNDKAPVLVTQPFSRIGSCYTVTESENLIISKLVESFASPYKFEIGDEIVGFNGVPWPEWIDRLTDAGIPIYASPGANDSSIRYNLLKSGMANVNLFEKINIKKADTGKIETMDTVYISPRDSLMRCTDLTQAEGVNDWRDGDFVYGILEGTNIGYIYLRTCPAGFMEFLPGEEWKPYETEFSNTFEKAILELMDTDGIIFDIRTNDGGRPEPLYKGLAHLVDNDEDIQPFQAVQRDTSNPDRTELQVVENYPWTPFKADEPQLSYDNPIIVMTGPDCISACDMLVALMSRYDEFTIIGKQPNGSATQVTGNRSYRISEEYENDYILTYLTNFTFTFSDEPDKYLMRRTDFLDIPVWFTKEDLINQVDTVREYAVKLINEAKNNETTDDNNKNSDTETNSNGD